MSVNIVDIISSTNNYNLHSHTQFCDGRDTMAQIAAAAIDEGMMYFAFTPHSPVNVESSCNMKMADVPEYLEECNRLKVLYDGKMNILTSLEIDYLGHDFGPHTDYFQNMPLDFRLGSVHFVPNKNGMQIDVDGGADNFKENLHLYFRDDLRYVVDKYFEQVLCMLEEGGIDLLGHFDKISGNASAVDPEIESNSWYEAYIDDVVSHLKGSGVVAEINTKGILDRKRFYPNPRWWKKLIDAGIPLAVDSDAHYASNVSLGRAEAFALLESMK